MQVAAAQINPVPGGITENMEAMRSRLRDAEEKDADLVVFPELAVTGYCISDLMENQAFIDANREAVAQLADQTTDTAAVVGFIDQDGEDLYNAAAILQHGEIQGIVRKQLLPRYRYFDESRYFTAANETRPIPITVADDTVQLGVVICEDMWPDADHRYTADPVQETVDNGADILTAVNASPFAPGKQRRRINQITKHINRTNRPFIYVNMVGAGDNNKNVIPFDGGSMVYDEHGECIAYLPRYEPASLAVDMHSGGTVAIPDTAWAAQVYDALVMSIRDYAAQTGFTEAVVPVSGGIDSSLGLALTVAALGADNVTAYTLPSAVNTETTQSLAHTVAANLDVALQEIPVQQLHDTVLEQYRDHTGEDVEQSVSRENVYARLRMVLTMLAANEKDALLIANGNETELALGYVTLYGDMAGGLAVLGDLSKTEVYTVAEHVNTRFDEPVIPEETFTIAPSAELAAGQEDPFDYDIVAPLVDLFIEERLDPVDVVERFEGEELEGFPDRVYNEYTPDTFHDFAREIYARIQESAYKRAQAPPIITVSNRSFGFDLRETILNQWRGR